MLHLEGVSKWRGSSTEGFELRVPRLSVSRGEVVALVGASGCGKSTLLDLIALILAPTEARRFELDPQQTGQALDVASLWARSNERALAWLRRQMLGYIPQTGGLLGFLNVRDNIRLSGRIKGDSLNDQEIAELAEQMGVAECLDRKPQALSIGQRQRVAILRAIAHRPALLLADEPTAALDKPRARAVLADLHALVRRSQLSLVLVSHDLDLVERSADRIYTFEVEGISRGHIRSTCRPWDERA